MRTSSVGHDADIDACCEGRVAVLGRALCPEYLTVGGNAVEGVVALAAARAAGSVVLIGFGVDSFVESASGDLGGRGTG